MSNYQPGRKAPNVSQYIAGLNLLPQDNDLSLDDDYSFENDLALFTNVEFIHNDTFDLDFDFSHIPGEEDILKPSSDNDNNNSSSFSPVVAGPVVGTVGSPNISSVQTSRSIGANQKKQKLSHPQRTEASTTNHKVAAASSTSSPSSNHQSTLTKDSTSTIINPDPLSIVIPTTNSSLAGPQTGNGDMNFDSDFPYGDIGFTPQGTINNHHLPYGAPATGYDYNVPPQSPFDPNHQLKTPVTTPPNGQIGVLPQGATPDSALLEASSRAAAEEDKRRRNTAASARFRYKKKQREQALEKSSKEMSDKLEALETKITQLEKENTWLRGLVVERTAKTSEEMAELYKTFKEEERSKTNTKKGVGTLKAEN